jgi:hypothetical protein
MKLPAMSLLNWRTLPCALLLLFLLFLPSRASAAQRDQDLWVARVLYETGQQPDGGFETQALMIFASELYKQDPSYSPERAVTVIREIRRQYRALQSGAPQLPDQVALCGPDGVPLSAARRTAIQPLLQLQAEMQQSQGLVTKYIFGGDKSYYDMAQNFASAVALGLAFSPDPTGITKIAAAGVQTVSLIAKGIEDFTIEDVKPPLDVQALPHNPVLADVKSNMAGAVAQVKSHLDTNANLRSVYTREFAPDTRVSAGAKANEVLEGNAKFAKDPLIASVNETLSDVQVTQEEINASLKKVTDVTNQIAQNQIEQARKLEQIDKEIEAVRGDIAKEREAREKREKAVADAQETQRVQQLKLQAAGSSVYLLSTAAKLLGSPEAAEKISVAGNAGIKIAKAFIDFNDNSGENGKTTALAGAILTGDLVGAAFEIFSLFGDSGPSMDQQILDQVNKLGEQIAELGQVMEHRFDRIDQTLNQIYKEMNSRFDDISNQIDNLSAQLDQARASLQRLEIGLNRLDQNMQTYMDALGRRSLTLNLNLTLDWTGPMQWNVGSPNWVDTSNYYHHWSTVVSRDAIQVGPVGRPVGDTDVIDQLIQYSYDQNNDKPVKDPVGNTHLDYNLNYLLRDVVERKFGLPALTNGVSNANLANPRDWAIAANAYYDLAKKAHRLESDNTTKVYHFDEDSTALSDVNQMISTGQDLQVALQNISTVSTASGRRANYRLFDVLMLNYRAQIPALVAAVQAVEKPHVASRRAGYTAIVNEFGLTGNVSQAGKSLTGARALLASFTALGLPASLEDNTELRASLYSAERVLNQADVVALYQAALTQPVVPSINLKAVLEERLTRYEDAVESALDFIDANPWYESYSLIDITLGRLNELKNRKVINQSTGKFSISGRVYEDKNSNGQWDSGEELADVAVSRSGMDSASNFTTVSSGADGTYTFTGLFPGTYTLSASACGPNLVFMPLTQEVKVTNANVSGKNFVGVRTPAIIGRVLSRTVAPLSGATVTVSDGNKTFTATTGPDGYYAVGGLATGVEYTVTPSHANHGFMPMVKRATLAQATSIATANFVGLPAPCVVGRVTNWEGAPMAGVPVERSGGGRGGDSAALTDADGYYGMAFPVVQLSNAASASYVIAADDGAHVFDPVSQAVNVTSTTVGVANFAAVGLIGNLRSDAGKIVFSAGSGSSVTTDEIYIMNVDGTNLKRLTNNTVSDWYPSITRDGKKITFTRNFEIYTMNADGSAQTWLTAGYSSSFSPDGTKIVFVSGRDGSAHDFYVMNADGSGQTRITNSVFTNKGLPVFSPDGKKIAFQAMVANPNVNYEIFVMNADGSNLSQITNNPADDHEPVFNSDGSKIAFSSNRDGITQIYVMEADGSGQRRLTFTDQRKNYPHYSPDGKRISFLSLSSRQFYTMNVDGSDQTPAALISSFPFGGKYTWGEGQVLPNGVNISDATVTAVSNTVVSASFWVTLTPPPTTAPVTFRYTTRDGTAIAGTDYVAKSGTVTFAPGEFQKQINIQVKGQLTQQPNKTFTVNLSSAQGSPVVGDDQGVGTVVWSAAPPPPPTIAPLEVAITSPSAGSTLTSLSTVNGTVSDGGDGSNINEVSILLKRMIDGKFWNGTTWGDWITVPTDLDIAQGKWSKGSTWPAGSSWPTGANLPGGTYRLVAYAAPKNGEVQTATTSITVDGPPLQPAPVISSFSPSGGTPGTLVTLTGTHFNDASEVTFNGVPATFTVVSATSITATVPANATTGRIEVTTPGGSGLSSENFTVQAPALTLSLDPSTFREGAGANAATGTITRNTPTTGKLVITLSSSNTNAATVPTEVTIEAGKDSATVAITAVDNFVVDGSKTATLTASAAGLVSATASATVTDDDAAGITVTPTTGLVTTEAGGKTSFTAVLKSQPSANVSFGLSSSKTAEGVPSPATLTFTPANWNQPQTVTVTGVADGVADGDQTYTIVTAAATSSDNTYAGQDAADVTVTNLDNNVPTLKLTLSAATVTEGGTLSATVTRNTPTTGALTVVLSSSNTGAATVPESVTIESGQASATFAVTAVDNQIVDGDKSAVITATATGLGAGTATVTVQDNDSPANDPEPDLVLNLELEEASVSEGGTISATVMRNAPFTEALEVTLTAAPATGLVLPSTITIPAGAASATFEIAATDDEIAQGDYDALITAAQGEVTSSQLLSVFDNEEPSLTLTVEPGLFSEAALPIRQAVATGTVKRNTSTEAAMTVNLNSSDSSEATVPTSVTIPAGSASASFVVMPVDDNIADGDQTVEISATTEGLSDAQSTVTVTDNEASSLTITVTSTRFAEGATGVKATITRNNEIKSDTPALTVNLTSSDTTEVKVPTRVTIPARTASITVAITAATDTLADGPQRVTLKAQATGVAEGTTTVTVLDTAATSNLMISGQLLSNSTPAFNKAPIPEATVVLRKGTVVVDEVTTDRLGNYNFKQLAAGNYTVTPLKTGFTFAPTTTSISLPRPSTIKGAPHALAVNFVGTPQTSIRGTLMRRLDNGVLMPVVGESLIAYHRDGAIYARTDKDGNYLFDRVGYTPYQIMPLMSGTYFRPRVRIASANATTPNLTGIDFLAEGTDSIAPQLTLLEPRSNSFTLDARSTLKIAGTASDSGGGNVAAVTVALAKFSDGSDATPDGFWYWKNNTFITLDSPVVVEAVAKGTTSWSLLEPTMVSDLRALPAGYYGIRATVNDGAGNVTRSTWRKFQITGSTTRSEVGGNNTTALTSSVRVSSAQASVSSIVLRFTGVLDSSDATDAATFVVQVKGQAVEVESVSYSNSTVTLGLPEGAVQAGDVIHLTWQNLRDSGGRVMAIPDLNLSVR